MADPDKAPVPPERRKTNIVTREAPHGVEERDTDVDAVAQAATWGLSPAANRPPQIDDRLRAPPGLLQLTTVTALQRTAGNAAVVVSLAKYKAEAEQSAGAGPAIEMPPLTITAEPPVERAVDEKTRQLTPPAAPDKTTMASATGERTEPVSVEGGAPVSEAAAKKEESARPAPPPGAQVGPEKSEAKAPVAGSTTAKPADIPTATGAQPAAAPAVAADSVDAWKSGIHSAARKLKTDKINAAPHVSRVQQAGTQTTNKQKAEGQKLPKDGKAAVSKPPKVASPQPLIPPKPDPVPEATKLVEDASNKPLGPQTMPPLVESPQHNMPTLVTAPPPAPATKEEAKPPETKAKPAEETPAKDPLKKGADKVNAPPEKKAEGGIRKGPSGEIIIEDKGGPPPPEPPLPKVFKTGIAAALARLMVDPKAEAESILNQVRSAAYAGELQRQFPDIGKTSVDDLTVSLQTELDGIRKEAGISEEEIKAAVDRRQQEIQKQKAEALGQVSATGDAEKQKLGQAGKDTLGIIAGTRQELDKSTEDKLEQAKGENDPEVVKLKRERLIRETQQKVAGQVVRYTQSGKKRQEEIQQIAALQRIAYRNAVRLDEEQINKQAGGNANLVWPFNITAATSRNWGNEQIRKLEQLVVDKGKETDGLVSALVKGVHDAGQQATELIRKWADTKLNQHRSFWEQLWQMFSDWASQARAESEAWESVRNKATRDAMAGDMNFLGGVVMTAGDQLSEEAIKNLDKLNAEQRAIVSTYYGLGPDGKPVADAKDAKNPIAAISAGLRVRILQQRGPKILEQFEGELDKTRDEEWDKLDALGKTQNTNFSAAWVCSEVKEALHGGLTGWNDEPRVFRALSGLTKVQSMAARRLYKLPPSQGGYGKDLDADLKDQLTGTFKSGHEYERAKALLEGNQAEADVASLREAMHGGLTGWGTDEKAIMETLRGKSAAEREKIKELYFQKYGKRLEEDLKEELTGAFEDEHDYSRATALMEGDTNKADAIAIDQAMYGGLTGIGTDRKAIEAVYEQVRQETEKELQEERRRTGKPPLTTKELEAEVKRRYEQIEASYNVTYKDKWGEGSESALRRAYKDELSDGELTLVNAIADNDLIKADAARIQVEKESIVYADDDVINGVLKHQYERALEELKRDKGPELYRKLEEERLKAERSGHPWDAYRVKEEQRRIEKQLELEARTKGKDYMKQLEQTYDTDFGSIGKGSFRHEIEKNMSGYELQEARKRIAQGGWLTPAQEIHFATEGLGTKEGMLTKALEGKTKEEIDEIRKEWARLHPGESLEERIDSDTSGRLNFELKHKLKGEPTSMKEEMDSMAELVEHEKEHSSWFAGDERARLEFRYGEMKKKYEVANDPNLSDEERARRIADFQRFSGYTNVSVQEHKESMEAVTNGLVTAVTTAIAVVVAGIAIVFSGGTATPGVLAAFAAWAGTAGGAATIAMGTALIGMGIRRAMLGSDYGIEDAGVDLAVGGVEAVAAAATAGLSKALFASRAESLIETLGAKLTQAEKQALIATLEKNPALAKGWFATMAQSASRANRMAAHGLSGAMFGAAGAVPSGLARTMLDSKTWEGGGAWEKILSGTAAGIPQGALGGGVMGMAGGIRVPHAPGKIPTGEQAARPLGEHELLPPGGKHTPETLGEGLPADLKKKVPISVDPDLESNTVRVHYDVDENGVFKDIHIRAGPTATPRDIELHVHTVRTMQKYAGLQGRVRVLLAKARAWIARSGAVPSRRFLEAKLEVEKLPAIIDEHMAKLADPELDPKVRAEIEADVAHLQDQLNHNQGIIEGTITPEEARGYVAAEGRKKAAAAPGEEGAPQPKKPAEEETPASRAPTVTEKPVSKAGAPPEQKPAVVEGPPPTATAAEEPAPATKNAAPDPKKVAELRGKRANLAEQLAERQRASVQRDDAVGALRDDIDALHERIENLQSKGKRTPSEEADLRSSLKRVENLQSKLESAETAAAREAAAVAETQKEIDTVDASLAQYKNARPWRALDMSTAKPEQLGLYGELEGTARMKAEGFEPLGKTVDPENILTPGEFDSAVEAYHGQTGIDGIYKRINPQTGETEYWCGEMKTTGDPNPKEPTGKGALSRTTTGDQLSDTWIRNNLRKSGLSESEQIDFLKALDAGKVKKFYAHTTSSGTKFYSVSGVNEVAIGPEITKF